jgi:DNA-binding CsgD family transcriptional regulator
MITAQDLAKALKCVQALIDAKDHDQFVEKLVQMMHPLMRAKVTGYNEADPVRKRFGFVIHPREIVLDPMIQAWVEHAHQNPILANIQKNPTDTGVYKITDFVEHAEFRKTALCRLTYQPMGAEYQIAMPLLVSGSAAIAVVFNRDYDFTKRDKELLQLLQPLISSAYAHVQRMTDLQLARQDAQASAAHEKAARQAMIEKLALSERQTEVFRQLVQGKSNKQIAGQLKLSIRTVEKYVELLLKKLKVKTRATAIARYQDLFGKKAEMA